MIELTCPSKTFLIGEYLALLGAPCLLVNTNPNFVLRAVESKTPSVKGISLRSPAGKFIQENASFFNQFQIKFFDPHELQGGFGASSAQFLLAYLLKNGETDIDSLLECYIHYAWNKQGIAPSGADVVSQLTGGITYFHKNKKECEKLDWPFENYSYLLIKTEHKIPTHQHLLDINLSDIKQLPDLALKAKQSIIEKKCELLADCINEFHAGLKQQGFVAQSTIEKITEIKSLPYVLAAKGCGALGADVIFVLCEKEEAVRTWCGKQNLRVFNG